MSAAAPTPFPATCKAFLAAGPVRLRGLRQAGPAGAARRLALSADGRWLLVTGAGGAALWDGATGEPVWRAAGAPAGAPALSTARAAWAEGEGARVRPLPTDEAAEGPEAVVAAGRVVALAFGQDGRTLVTLDAAGGLAGASAETGERLWSSRCEGLAPRAAALARDARVAAAVDADGTCAVIYPQTGTRLFRLGEAGALRAVTVSADGQQVLCGAVDGARLWDAASGALARRLPGADVDAVALAPGARLALGARRDGKLVLWDVAGGHALERLDLGGFLAATHDVAFSPDGRRFVVAGDARRGLDGSAGRVAALLRFELAP
ncbi:MAG: PQQ-binding-like beta-propeller repeat protein [Planctomycetes bacterium]|nr:PQQ-binding-like beta-propeller repeat protein [Planctomycetota bacterium]